MLAEWQTAWNLTRRLVTRQTPSYSVSGLVPSCLQRFDNHDQQVKVMLCTIFFVKVGLFTAMIFKRLPFIMTKDKYNVNTSLSAPKIPD